MTTVNSLSGGRTSSYLAANYPADLDIFALVCIDDHNAGKSIDKKLLQMANDRLQKYCSHQKEFVATSEDPIILKTIFELEQFTGREITWLRGLGWEDMLRARKAIPNMDKRFCTTVLKILPIFEFLYLRHTLPVQMRIGYRYDEIERANHFSQMIHYPTCCQYRPKSATWIQRWQDILWCVGEFVLIDNKVLHTHVQQFWQGKPVSFAPDSNCQNCFWKTEQQLRKNYDANPDIMKWAAVMEALYDHTFKENYSLLDIRKIGLQLDFFFGTGSGCQAGFCTD